MRRIGVGILGATGHVGQQYLRLLQNHPWFEVRFLASSKNADDIESAKKSCSFVFSAMSNEGAKLYEERYAAAGLPVVSNASYHRMSPDVPIIIPEVNASHLSMIPLQRSRGFIVTKPNCSLQSYMIPLAPLHERFEVEKIIVTTLQAISGAGYPGVASLDIVDNVIPYISGEEEKCEREPLKIWGNAGIEISAHCNRVPVLDGHLACVSVKFRKKPSEQEILALWQNFPGLDLPSAPKRPIIYREECDRPQTRLDRDAENGMAVTVGRLRRCPILDYRFVGLSHNTIRGAAGGGILIAELLHKEGYLETKSNIRSAPSELSLSNHR